MQGRDIFDGLDIVAGNFVTPARHLTGRFGGENIRLMRPMIFFCLSIFLSLSTQAAETEPVRSTFNVVLVVDHRLPAAPKAMVEESLGIAADWIDSWYKRRVLFRIDRTEDIDSYMTGHFQKLPVPEKWRGFPYALDGTDSVARFVSQQTSALRGQSIPVLQSYAPEELRPLITSAEESAKNLLAVYDRKVQIWRNLRAPGGAPFFDTGFPQKHSYWYWERIFESVRPDRVTDHLIVTNVMLLDDALSDAPPHSLLRGGLLNGMAEEEALQAIVSTFPILTDVPAVSDLRDPADFSARQRVLALAHIIAHEFGAHVIEGYKDVYDHEACLAAPTSGLAYSATLRRLFSAAPCTLDHPTLDRRARLTDRYEAMAHRYLEIKNYTEAEDSVRRAYRLEPNRPLLKLMLRQLEARTKK